MDVTLEFRGKPRKMDLPGKRSGCKLTIHIPPLLLLRFARLTISGIFFALFLGTFSQFK